MMIHQALSGDYKGFGEAIKKHKVEKTKKPLKALHEKVVHNCLECAKPGHMSWQCSYVAPPPKPHTWSIYNNTNYVVYKNQEGHPKVKFLGPRNKDAPKMIWVPKTLVEKAFPSGMATAPTKMVWVPKLKALATKEEMDRRMKLHEDSIGFLLSLVSGHPPTSLDIKLIDVKDTLMFFLSLPCVDLACSFLSY